MAHSSTCFFDVSRFYAPARWIDEPGLGHFANERALRRLIERLRFAEPEKTSEAVARSGMHPRFAGGPLDPWGPCASGGGSADARSDVVRHARSSMIARASTSEALREIRRVRSG